MDAKARQPAYPDRARQSDAGCVNRGFNGAFRDECLDESRFESLEQARQAIAIWRLDYNEIKPNSNYGRIPPATCQSLESPLNWRFKATQRD